MTSETAPPAAAVIPSDVPPQSFQAAAALPSRAGRQAGSRVTGTDVDI